MSKIKEYLAGGGGVLVATAQAAKDVLGDTPVIAYEGSSKDEFRKILEEYKAPPTVSAYRYQEYDFGSEIVVFSALNNIVDLVVAPPVEEPVGTTVAPEVSLDSTEEEGGDVEDDSEDTPPAGDGSSKKWF